MSLLIQTRSNPIGSDSVSYKVATVIAPVHIRLKQLSESVCVCVCGGRRGELWGTWRTGSGRRQGGMGEGKRVIVSEMN